MNRVRQWYEHTPKWLKNRYSLTIIGFLFFMLFFDHYNVIYRYKQYRELQTEKQRLNYYVAETEKIKEQLTQLFATNESLERFAREQYYMKKADEDVIILRPKKEE